MLWQAESGSWCSVSQERVCVIPHQYTWAAVHCGQAQQEIAIMCSATFTPADSFFQSSLNNFLIWIVQVYIIQHSYQYGYKYLQYDEIWNILY